MEKILKGYTFKLYPNQEQKTLIEKGFGCSRYIYNYFLDKTNGRKYIKTFDYIKDLPLLSKEKELEKTINIVESAGKAYFSFNDNIYKVELNTLINDEYITTNMTNPKTGEALDGCVRKTLNNDLYVYTYGGCEPILVPFSVELNGGESSQTFEKAYYDTTKIELKNPTHQNVDFNGWKIVKDNSLLKGNTLVIGTTETVLYGLGILV